MSKNETIVCFGDSITMGYAPFLESELKGTRYGNYKIINEGIDGNTSRDALERIKEVVAYNPEVVILGFGINDCARDRNISVGEYKENVSKIIHELRKNNIETMILTLNPKAYKERMNKVKEVIKGKYNAKTVISTINPQGSNKSINKFNKIIKKISFSEKIKIININYFWKLSFKSNKDGLKDDIHPNEKGNKLLAKHLRRRSQIILWQYNGDPCECNYACPYCPADPKKQKGHYFEGTIEEWHDIFKNAFGDQRLVFYLAYGEPMAGKKFYDVLEMIGNEPNWHVRMTSNISQSLNRLMETKVVKDGRLDINASFHPTMTTRDVFLKKILFLRENGIEPSIVYVMWPPLLKRFEEDFRALNQHNFLIHVRRFDGFYEGKKYPQAYTEKERNFIARYMDDATIKYMLAYQPSFGKLTWSGVDFFIVDNKGNVGYNDSLKPKIYSLGNLFRGDCRPFTEPRPFPGRFMSDTTVDGVANFLELNYDQLEDGNNTMAFSRQGGVYHTPEGVYYKNMYTNFDNPQIRAEYRFPPRYLSDCSAILQYQGRTRIDKTKEILSFLTPLFVKKLYWNTDRKLRKSNFILKTYTKIVNVTTPMPSSQKATE
jgi:lysophospholipase L1-like esterase/MoaA/NifB/PqqE/SkfB family radical SAM enzyme